MYGMSDFRIAMIPDEVGMVFCTNHSTLPTWMDAEHYENCNGGLQSWLRRIMR